MEYDFSGYATKNDLKCSDGRTIRSGAFNDCDGKTVPLVWMHQHNEMGNVLGKALLKVVGDGVRAYCSFNDSDEAKTAREYVRHGDVNQLSIFARDLVQRAGDVLHGNIKEVSLVLAGANPGAFIDDIAMAHAEDGEGVAVIYTDEFIDDIKHSDENITEEVIEHSDTENKKEEKEVDNNSGKEETVQDVIDSMNEKQ